MAEVGVLKAAAVRPFLLVAKATDGREVRPFGRFSVQRSWYIGEDSVQGKPCKIHRHGGRLISGDVRRRLNARRGNQLGSSEASPTDGVESARSRR